MTDQEHQQDSAKVEIIEREVVKLNNVEFVQFQCPNEEDGHSTFSLDPHELYWNIIEWEDSNKIQGIALLEKLRENIGIVSLSNTHLSQIYHEVIRIAESREDAIKKKLEASRREIAS